MSATVALTEKWPVLGRQEWLRVWVDLGRAPRTIDTYARGLAEYLEMCEGERIDPLAASRADVAGRAAARLGASADEAALDPL